MGQLIYDSEFALLTFYKEHKLLELEWKRSSPESEYRSVFNKAVEIASRQKIEFFMSDLRKSGAVSLANMVWLKSFVIPKAVEYGVLKIGLVLNEDLFSKIYAESIRSSLIKNKILISFFDQRTDALSWFNISEKQ
jgi:hypothetical protein